MSAISGHPRRRRKGGTSALPRADDPRPIFSKIPRTLPHASLEWEDYTLRDPERLLFIINSLAPDVPMRETFKGVMPFFASEIVRVALLVSVPAISLLLPRLLA